MARCLARAEYSMPPALPFSATLTFIDVGQCKRFGSRAEHESKEKRTCFLMLSPR